LVAVGSVVAMSVGAISRKRGVSEAGQVSAETARTVVLRDGMTWKHEGMVFDIVNLTDRGQEWRCHPIWFDGPRALDVLDKWAGKEAFAAWLHFDREIQLNRDGFPVDERVLGHVEQHACDMGADGIGEAARSAGDVGPRFILFRVPQRYRDWKKARSLPATQQVSGTAI